MNSKVLIIDDEKDICYLISEILKDENYFTESTTNSKDAIEKFSKYKPDLVILDVWLGNSDLDGIELLSRFKQIDVSIPVIIISGHGTVDMAVKAIKNGAYDFLEKPFNSEKILILAKRAIESSKLVHENKLLKKIANPNTPIIGESAFITNLKKNMIKFSESNSRIFINGPSGSGKKLIAQNIHNHTTKSKSMLNIIDCQNLNSEDLESMFTIDTSHLNKNIFVKSNNNTLIFDNIEFLPINFQKHILSYLENNNLYKKIGVNFDIKIIAISSEDLEKQIKKGNFIKPLFDRLKVLHINVPNIKDRRDDIIPICKHYLDFFNKNKKYKFNLSTKAQNILKIYNWPGNVKQIINYIEKTIILNQHLNLNSDYEINDLPIDMGEITINKPIINNFSLSLKEARQNFEKEYFLSQIKHFNGNISKISEFTGMERTALYRKFKSLNILLDNKK